MPAKIQVWSTGLETWEDATMSPTELKSLVHVHDKTIGYERFGIFKDSTDRWVKVLVDSLNASHTQEEGNRDASK